MQETINNRVSLLVKALEEGNDASFARTTGLSSQVVQELLADPKEHLSYKVLTQILLAYPLVSANWLLLGDGEMLRAGAKTDSGPAEPLLVTLGGYPCNIEWRLWTKGATTEEPELGWYKVTSEPYGLNRHEMITDLIKEHGAGPVVQVAATYRRSGSRTYIAEVGTASDLYSTQDFTAELCPALTESGWKSLPAGIERLYVPSGHSTY